MSYRTEFPDFDPATMPAIPAGFEDESWHNDACPSFHHEGLRLTIWVDYADPQHRDSADSTRFALIRTDEERTWLGELVDSDDWSDILAGIEEASR